ncbi:hypothetical protein EI94DRAFT_1315810 [Lactarius quietus]|nr:hypothetical protein EI94DRAFT_1315810 [Lactarius quietus]
MIWWSKLRAAAGPNPDPKGDGSGPDAELISLTAMPKYRDPLHVMLEYIAEERPNCDMVIVHDDDLTLLDPLGDGAEIETLQPDVVLSCLQSSKLAIHEFELGQARKVQTLRQKLLGWLRFLPPLKGNFRGFPIREVAVWLPCSRFSPLSLPATSRLAPCLFFQLAL